MKFDYIRCRLPTRPFVIFIIDARPGGVDASDAECVAITHILQDEIGLDVVQISHGEYLKHGAAEFRYLMRAMPLVAVIVREDSSMDRYVQKGEHVSYNSALVYFDELTDERLIPFIVLSSGLSVPLVETTRKTYVVFYDALVQTIRDIRARIGDFTVPGEAEFELLHRSHQHVEDNDPSVVSMGVSDRSDAIGKQAMRMRLGGHLSATADLDPVILEYRRELTRKKKVFMADAEAIKLRYEVLSGDSKLADEFRARVMSRLGFHPMHGGWIKAEASYGRHVSGFAFDVRTKTYVEVSEHGMHAFAEDHLQSVLRFREAFAGMDEGGIRATILTGLCTTLEGCPAKVGLISIDWSTMEDFIEAFTWLRENKGIILLSGGGDFLTEELVSSPPFSDLFRRPSGSHDDE